MQTILFVDDNPLNVSLYRGVIATADGMTPVCHTDPSAALAWCRSQLPSLVVVDYNMPGIDGLQFIRRFRDIPGTHGLPVVMLTSTHDPVLWQMALEAGATEFLMKPIERSQFLACLMRLAKTDGKRSVSNPG